MFPRVTLPSAAPLRALDLHVLGLPPAFALSQDQTLKLDEIDSGKSLTFARNDVWERRSIDEVHHSDRLPNRCDVP